MIGTTRNPHSIYIPRVQTGCCKMEFDSTYPTQLNGIINEEEFQESIKNINKAIYSKILIIIFVILPILCLLAGAALMIAGGIIFEHNGASGIPLLIYIGLGVFCFGLFYLMIGICVMQSMQTSRLRKTVAEESAKYNMRSPMPTTWRLDANKITVRGHKGSLSTRLIYTLVISIGNSASTQNREFNQISFGSSSHFQQQNNMPPPSPYFNQQNTARFCLQCGAPKQSQVAKFCSSCGQSFN